LTSSGSHELGASIGVLSCRFGTRSSGLAILVTSLAVEGLASSVTAAIREATVLTAERERIGFSVRLRLCMGARLVMSMSLGLPTTMMGTAMAISALDSST